MFSFILLQGRGDHWVSRAEIKSVESHERRQLLYIHNTELAEHMGIVWICSHLHLTDALTYCNQVGRFSPPNTPHLIRKCSAGPESISPHFRPFWNDVRIENRQAIWIKKMTTCPIYIGCLSHSLLYGIILKDKCQYLRLRFWFRRDSLVVQF